MRTKRKNQTEEEIDNAVIAESGDNTRWDKPVKVRRSKSSALALPPALAARAAFFARLHRETNLEEWVKRIIQERVDLEEAAFAGCKRELGGKH